MTKEQIMELVNEVLIRGSEGAITGRPGFEALTLNERKVYRTANAKHLFIGEIVSWGAHEVAKRQAKQAVI